MKIVAEQTVIFDRLHALTNDTPDGSGQPFGYQQEPSLAMTDFIGEYALGGQPTSLGNLDWSRGAPTGPDAAGGDYYSSNDAVEYEITGNAAFDGVIKCVHQAEVFVPHDNIKGGYYYGYGSYKGDNLPTLYWYAIATDDDDYYCQSYARQPIGFQSMRYESGSYLENDATMGADSFMCFGAPTVPCQGFRAFVSYQPAWSDYPDPFLEADAIGGVAVVWHVTGAKGYGRWYSVRLTTGGDAAFYYNDYTVPGGFDGYDMPSDTDPAGWVFVDSIKLGGGVAELQLGGNWGANDYPFPIDLNTDLPIIPWDDTNGIPKSPDVPIFVKFGGGQMQVKVGNQISPFVFPHDFKDEDGLPDWLIDEFYINAQNILVVDWSIHPTKWVADTSIMSNPQNAAFTPTSDQFDGAKCHVHCLPSVGAASSIFDSTSPGLIPPGSNASVIFPTEWQGSLYRYVLELSSPQSTAGSGSYQGVAYSDFTPFVFAVTIEFTGTHVYDGSMAAYLGDSGVAPMPERIQVTASFDINTLSVKSSAVLRFPNFRGEWTNQNLTGYLDEVGQFGVGIDLGSQGYQIANPGPGNPSGLGDTAGPTGGVFRVFTGIANVDFDSTWGGQGRDHIDIHCEDFWQMLSVPIWVLKFMDGYNVYYAMYQLAQLGGLTDRQIGFMEYVPTDPFSESPSSPPNGDLFLPAGPSGTSLTRFTPGSIARDMMLKISYALGMCLWFDVFGVLQFEPFAPSGGWNAPSPILYSEYAGSAYSDPPGAEDGLDNVLGGSYHGTLRETRTSIIVMGPNIMSTAFSIIAAGNEFSEMILQDGWEDGGPFAGGSVGGSYTPGPDEYLPNPTWPSNYMGYKNTMVWADNNFATWSYAAKAAQSMAKFLALPDREVQFTALDKPGQMVYPGYLVKVLYSRSGCSDLNMFVTSVTWVHEKGQVPIVQITARIVPPDWYSS